MHSPENSRLLDALHRFIDRFEWFTTGRSQDSALETDDVKLLLAQWDEELEPLRHQLTDARLVAGIESVLPWIEKARAKVRLMFLTGIHDLLARRMQWLMWEVAMKVPERVKKALDEASPEQREEMLAKGRELLGQEVNVGQMFQEAMQGADEGEAGWRKGFLLFKNAWRAECTPDIETRLQSANLSQTRKWLKEVRTEIAGVYQLYPEYSP